ncbi:TetR/AcrR family transcriptional regulator, partial [Mesorhizobium sp. M2D.F.Ca.ET.145.01.1.1]
QDGIAAHLEVLDELMPAAKGPKTHRKAMAMLSLMVGAVTISRILKDEEMSQGFLDAAAGEVRRIAAAQE